MLKKFSLLFILVVLNNCASYTDEIKDLRQDYIGGKYQAALDKIEKSSLKTSKKDRLLYHLEKSMITDRLEDLKTSRSLLLRADTIVDELYTTSISKTAATFVFNDSASDYEGEDYEKVAIHTLLALSFLEDKQLKEAQIEAKGIDLRLHQITQNYDPKYAHYKDDAFGRFLSGIVYEAMGKWDDAIIDYNQALAVYTNSDYSNFYEGSVPEAVITSLYGVAHKRKRSDIIKDLKDKYSKIIDKYDAQIRETPNGADLVVFHEAGEVTTKKEKDFVFPAGDQIVRFSFPVIEKQSIDWQNKQNSVRVDGQHYSAVNALNYNALAYRCLEDRRGRMILKSMARLIAKGVLTHEAQKNFGPIGGLIANIAGVVTETADTRSWTLLPQAFYVNRIRVSPGQHKLEFTTSGKVTQAFSLDLKEGEMKIFRSKS